MLIILALYVVLLWLVFSKFKWSRLGWISGTVAALGGMFILAVFLAMFNHLTPSGTFTVVSRVIEVTPNVSGQVTAIPVKPNEPVKAGTVLFKIDPTPFQYKVNQLQASLAHAKQQVKQLKASYEQASANVEGLTKQHAFNTQRLADIQKLTSEQRCPSSGNRTRRFNMKPCLPNCWQPRRLRKTPGSRWSPRSAA